MINLVAVAVGIYAVLVGGLFLAQRQLIYCPSQTLASTAEAGIPEMQVLRVTTDDGLGLTFWYRPADKGQPTLVYFHGNGGNLSGRGLKVRSYLNARYGVLLAAYRGYGGNPGKPSETGLYSDARAQLKFLESQDVAPRDWVLYGESLGSGVAVHMAFEKAGAGDDKPAPVGAVVLEAPFSSLGDAAQAHYPYVPARLMIRDRFDSMAKIGRIDAPVFIFQGELDGVISPKKGKRLFQGAREPKQAKWVAGAGHNNLYDHGVADMVIDFVRKSHGVRH
jgi:fermentation-respiration switch protein FrsA (DUF1100 family)